MTDTQAHGVQGVTYRGGHFDTSMEGFPLQLDMPMLKTGWIPLGDDPEGPALAVAVSNPGEEYVGQAHFHNSAQVRVILEGSMKIGNKWYRSGDIRIQEPGIPYGPERWGPDGARQLLFFANRRGMYPHYRDREVETMANLMRGTGIEPN